MLLQNFLDRFEEAKAERKIRDFIEQDGMASAKAEFLGHFLTSVFQPVLEYDGSKLTTVGYEAFIRPVAGNVHVSPAEYFEALAPDNHSFVDRLCRELHVTNFLSQATPNEFISLNVSDQTLEAHGSRFSALQKDIDKAQKAGLLPERIMAELNMSPSLDSGILYTFVSQLKEAGVKITLEGFDSDCASFDRIVQNQPNTVKFNRSWLQKGLRGTGSRQIVRNLVSSLNGMGTKCHFEQLETEEEFEFARNCGATRFQGYYFGQPNAELIRPILPSAT